MATMSNPESRIRNPESEISFLFNQLILSGSTNGTALDLCVIGKLHFCYLSKNSVKGKEKLLRLLWRNVMEIILVYTSVFCTERYFCNFYGSAETF